MVHVRCIGIAAIALALLPGLAVPHERGDRARGVVERIDEAALAVRASDGHVVTFETTPETRFVRAGVPVERADVQLGERVVVDGRRNGERLEAVRVRMGARTPASGSGSGSR